MHDIEPHYLWRNLYRASLDERSPFYGYQNSEVFFTDQIYNHLIHPQWDFFGAETLFIKQLFTDYETGYVILEFLGEWNDVLHNDIMFLKRDVIEEIMAAGINKFILIGDHILNWHAEMDDYYQEWFEELEEGWIALVNARPQVRDELRDFNLDQYLIYGGDLDEMSWRRWSPPRFYREVAAVISHRLD